MKKIYHALKWRIWFLITLCKKQLWNFRRFWDWSKKEEVKNITVIVVGRNDNYGGDFSKRLQVTLDWNLKHLPNPELIYIEWNQIKDRPSDCDWIIERYPNSRCFIVPEDIHRNIASNPERMPVMEYFAKNIGIRNAQNDWILMINADVFLGTDILKNIKKLNNKTVYGSHYIGIKWNGEDISDSIVNNKKLRVAHFTAPYSLSTVVGNFILTHKKNWQQARGYDERLNNVRAGVDSNGLKQLLYLGLKKQVIGHHFHLDHPESIIYGKNDTHGTTIFDNIPYKNPDNWGFIDYKKINIGDKKWELKME